MLFNSFVFAVLVAITMILYYAPSMKICMKIPNRGGGAINILR